MARLRGSPPRIATADTRRVKPLPKRADPFYLSPEWRGLVGRVIAKRGRRCEDCGRSDARIYGDHVHELRDGGAALDEANVRLRCPACHGSKTIAARVRRLATTA